MGLRNWLRGTKGSEQRSTLATTSDWWRSAFSGTTTNSGEKITTDSAMQQPAVFSCIRVISEDVASLPLKVYSKNGGSRDVIDSHPVAKLFHSAPNPEMSPFTFKETMTAHVLTYGNAYAEIERNGAGEIIALWSLLPDKMQIKVVDGKVVYEYDGRLHLTSDKVLHIRGLGYDGILGYSPIAYARETIGISKAMERTGGAFFANSSRPSGILSHPARLSEDATKRLREGWDSMFSGSSNVGRTAILEEGMEWKQLSIPHSDAQWLEARNYALQDICRIYRMPPHMVQDLSRATFSNIEHQQIAYMQQTLMPWLRRWEQEVNRKLIDVDDRSIYTEFLAEEMLRGNTPERFDAYRTARESGWMSVNEIRKRENLNPIEGGDTYIQPLNFIDTELASTVQTQEPSAPQEPEEVPKEEDIELVLEAAGRKWLSDSVSRAVAIIKNTSVRKLDKVSDKDWGDWVKSKNPVLSTKVEEILTPACCNAGLDPKRGAEVLTETLHDVLAGIETREQRREICESWCRSFRNAGSLEIVIERIKQEGDRK